MSDDLAPVKIEPKAVIPTGNGTSLFLGNDDKTFVIFIDSAVGIAIYEAMSGQKRERPLTHELMQLIVLGFGGTVERVTINDVQGQTYFARVLITAENEIQQRKFLEIDARPSDSIALALRASAPIYVARHVWKQVTDESHLLRALKEKNPPPEDFSGLIE
jgi:uncharacterized protein